jgi:hypothetical protein
MGQCWRDNHPESPGPIPESPPEMHSARGFARPDGNSHSVAGEPRYRSFQVAGHPRPVRPAYWPTPRPARAAICPSSSSRRAGGNCSSTAQLGRGAVELNSPRFACLSLSYTRARDRSRDHGRGWQRSPPSASKRPSSDRTASAFVRCRSEAPRPRDPRSPPFRPSVISSETTRARGRFVSAASGRLRRRSPQ